MGQLPSELRNNTITCKCACVSDMKSSIGTSMGPWRQHLPAGDLCRTDLTLGLDDILH